MTPRQGETHIDEVEVDDATVVNGPRKMTFAENVILTIKVLAGFGLLGAALWGISFWKAAG